MGSALSLPADIGEDLTITHIISRESDTERHSRLNHYWSARPPSNVSIHDAMCNRYCMASDALRTNAMDVSHCSCLQLSTQNDSSSFTTEGDFCRKNSAIMLCSQIDAAGDMCRGMSKCEMNDFMCTRREYNKVEVATKGFGNECTSCASSLLGSCVPFLLVLFHYVRS